MKILITGGAGFIGSHVAENLIKNKKVKKIVIIDNLKDGSKKNLKGIIKNSRFKIFKKDINNLNSIINHFKNIDYVIHLAALSDVVPSIENPREYLNTNIMGTVNVLEAMRKHKVKNIIYTASSSCYGNKPETPTNEKTKINPKYPYAFSKYIGEEVIKHYSDIYSINYVSLRLFNVYGTRSRTNSAYGAALGVFLKQKIANHPFTVIGNGKQKRDFINVKDVSHIIYKIIEKKITNSIFNIGTGKPRSILELVKILKGKKIFIKRRPGEPKATHADIKKIQNQLKWKPVITLEQGVNEILEHLKYWKDAPLWTKKKINQATKNWFKYMKD